LIVGLSASKDRRVQQFKSQTVASAGETTHPQNYLAIILPQTQSNGMFYMISTQGTAILSKLVQTITVDYVEN
jgi:hypothetical protein